MSIYGEASDGLTAPAGGGAKTAGPLVQLQAKWGALDDKQQNIVLVVALALLALVGYMMLGPSGPDTWSGDDITINGNCASGTSEFLASSVATSNGRGEASCGPCMVPNVGITTKVHCNRDYTFGAGYESFFEEYAGRQLTLIQDAHDPNDVQWTRTGVVDQDTGHSSTQFATVTIPAGAEATFHCFVPIGCQEDHAHTPNEYPNFVDPQGGWTESSESYMEDNGIERKRFFKKVTAAGAPVTYPLHHTTHKGWGYVYLVELQKAGYCPVHTPPANKIIVTDLHAGHACGPKLVQYPSTCTEVHCDRHYKFGSWEGMAGRYGRWDDFFNPASEPTRRRNLWLIQDAHDPNDVADLTSQVNSMTGLIDTNSAGSVTTCQGGRSECKFVRLHIPNGYTAQIHAFVPLEEQCAVAQQQIGYQQPGSEYHAHTANDMPSQIDRNGQGWTDMHACYSEDPGAKCEDASKTQPTYELTFGYCRPPNPACAQIPAGQSCPYQYPEGDAWKQTASQMGLMWEPTHAPFDQAMQTLWDCSPSSYTEDVDHTPMNLAQCKDACDRDPECGAFDIEAHTATGETGSECCLFKPGNVGQGSTQRHCWVKCVPGQPCAGQEAQAPVYGPSIPCSEQRDQQSCAAAGPACHWNAGGENGDSSTRPRGHFTKTITPTTQGVITEASAAGVGESTGVNAEHHAGHFAYDLYHTVHTGWGYVYIVELCGGADGNQCTSTPSYGR